MIVAQKKYKNSRGWLSLYAAHNYDDGNGYEKRGNYRGINGTVTIFINTRKYSGDNSRNWVTQLEFNYGGYEFTRVFNVEFTDRGLCQVCAKFIRDVLNGNFQKDHK